MSDVQFSNKITPSTPPTGKTKIFTDSADKHTKQVDDTGAVTDLTAGGAAVFGNDYQFAAAEARTTTTSATFQTKTSLTTGGITGTYRLNWTAIIDNGGALGEFRLQNTTDATTTDGPYTKKSGDSGEFHKTGGFNQVVFAGVAKTFEIQFRDQASGNTQGIQQARIEIFRVV